MSPVPHQHLAGHTMSTFNPRILDASIRDVIENLSDGQKAEIVLHAMNMLKLVNSRSQHIVENGVQSCLQIPGLPTTQVVQALLLRGRARFAAGDISGAKADLQEVLELEPGHPVATSLLSLPSATVSTKSRLWNLGVSGKHLSADTWREIALYLPRRDLKTLLFVPHILSRIAFELVFHELDLNLGVCLAEEAHASRAAEWVMNEDVVVNRDLKLEKWLAQRTADIIARIMIDPSFSKLVRTLRISASPHHRCDHMVFQTTMLAIALPKLMNLKQVYFSGSNEVACKFAEVLATSHPFLQGLALEPMVASHIPHLPQLTNLTKFSYIYRIGNHSVSTLLAQNRTTLRELYLHTGAWAFPSSLVSLGNLTHLHFHGTIEPGCTTIQDILTKGRRLVSLRLRVVLNCNVAGQFQAATRMMVSGGGGYGNSRGHSPPAQPPLPHLTQFGFSVAPTLGEPVDDPTLFPSVAEFIRLHPSLTWLELDAPTDEFAQRRVGYDAGVLGVLPGVLHVRYLHITLTRDLHSLSSKFLAWVIPREVTALSLAGLPKRDPAAVIANFAPGFPPSLKYISLDGGPVSDVTALLEKFVPPTVRLARINDKFHTVTWHVGPGFSVNSSPSIGGYSAGSGVSGYGSGAGSSVSDTMNYNSMKQVTDLDEWPERRALLHMDEWLEWLGCEDAAWAVQATRSLK